MDIFLLYCLCPFLGGFLVQFFFGCRTAIKPLRFIPLYCAAVTLIFAVRAWNTPACSSASMAWWPSSGA